MSFGARIPLLVIRSAKSQVSAAGLRQIAVAADDRAIRGWTLARLPPTVRPSGDIQDTALVSAEAGQREGITERAEAQRTPFGRSGPYCRPGRPIRHGQGSVVRLVQPVYVFAPPNTTLPVPEIVGAPATFVGDRRVDRQRLAAVLDDHQIVVAGRKRAAGDHGIARGHIAVTRMPPVVKELPAPSDRRGLVLVEAQAADRTYSKSGVVMTPAATSAFPLKPAAVESV